MVRRRLTEIDICNRIIDRGRGEPTITIIGDGSERAKSICIEYGAYDNNGESQVVSVVGPSLSKTLKMLYKQVQKIRAGTYGVEETEKIKIIEVYNRIFNLSGINPILVKSDNTKYIYVQRDIEFDNKIYTLKVKDITLDHALYRLLKQIEDVYAGKNIKYDISDIGGLFVDDIKDNIAEKANDEQLKTIEVCNSIVEKSCCDTCILISAKSSKYITVGCHTSFNDQFVRSTERNFDRGLRRLLTRVEKVFI